MRPPSSLHTSLSQYQPPSHTASSPTNIMSHLGAQPPQTMMSPNGTADDLRHHGQQTTPTSLQQQHHTGTDMSRQVSNNNNNGGTPVSRSGGGEGISENGSETGGCFSTSLRTSSSSSSYDPVMMGVGVLHSNQQQIYTNNMIGNYPPQHASNNMVKYEMT